MALTIHQAGIDAAINAQSSGFSGVTLNRVELYNGSTRVATLPLEGVQVIEPGRIYVVAQDSSPATYDVRRIDFYTSTGVKFASAQNGDGSVIQSKAGNTTLLLAHQLNLASAPGSVAPSGDVSVYAPQATESLLGTAEIATQGETDAGSDDTRFVTPKKLGQWLRNTLSSSVTSTSTTTPASVKGVKTAYDAGVRQATESLRGQLEIASQSEAASKTNHTRALTPKRLWEILAQFATRGEAHFVGQIVYSSKETPEPGFFALDGSTIPNGVIDYSELANSGSRWISISGNNIVLKDAVDFIRGQGSSGRAVGGFEGDAIRNITGSLQAIDDEALTGSDSIRSIGALSASTFGNKHGLLESGGVGCEKIEFDASNVVPTANENRPKSVTALVCIYHGVI